MFLFGSKPPYEGMFGSKPRLSIRIWFRLTHPVFSSVSRSSSSYGMRMIVVDKMYYPEYLLHSVKTTLGSALRIFVLSPVFLSPFKIQNALQLFQDPDYGKAEKYRAYLQRPGLWNFSKVSTLEPFAAVAFATGQQGSPTFTASFLRLFWAGFVLLALLVTGKRPALLVGAARDPGGMFYVSGEASRVKSLCTPTAIRLREADQSGVLCAPPGTVLLVSERSHPPSHGGEGREERPGANSSRLRTAASGPYPTRARSCPPRPMQIRMFVLLLMDTSSIRHLFVKTEKALQNRKTYSSNQSENIEAKHFALARRTAAYAPFELMNKWNFVRESQSDMPTKNLDHDVFVAALDAIWPESHRIIS